MGRYRGVLRCPRCSGQVTEADAFGGCPSCVAEGVAANVHPVYDLDTEVAWDDGAPGLFRYRSLLPLADSTTPVSLGEGATPLLAVPRLGEQLGAQRLFIKDESQNPTWSYKDRLAAVAVTKACELGADAVVVATTGNHGAAAAAYAAAAGLRCVALTLASVPTTMKVLMQAYGAQVVALQSAPARWQLMAHAVAARRWVPLSGFRNPPVGSNPFGIDGYKTIAYELVSQLGAAPDAVVVPTAYADGLSGIHRGFEDLLAMGRIARTPRMVAAEPFGPYARTLEEGGDASQRVRVTPTVAFSTATPIATYQGIHALRASDGLAAAVGSDGTILAAQLQAARAAGLYMEAATAVGLPVIADLIARGALRATDTIVLVDTSSGLKDVGATARVLPEVPVIEPELRALDKALDRIRR